METKDENGNVINMSDRRKDQPRDYMKEIEEIIQRDKLRERLLWLYAFLAVVGVVGSLVYLGGL